VTNVEDILKVARSDAKLQTIINNYFQRIGFTQHLVGGLTFREGKDDSPAFCLGFQVFNTPIGLIFVSEGLSKILKEEELEFVILHEMGHIMKNHFVSTSFVWLMKSWIVDIIADGFEVSKQKAREYLEWAKAIYVILSGGRRTMEEEAKARVELKQTNMQLRIKARKNPQYLPFLNYQKGTLEHLHT
jgi:Zn-dependent protease with chaperone function